MTVSSASRMKGKDCKKLRAAIADQLYLHDPAAFDELLPVKVRATPTQELGWARIAGTPAHPRATQSFSNLPPPPSLRRAASKRSSTPTARLGT